MLFRKGLPEEEPEVKLIPQVPVERRLNPSELRSQYGIGYNLLLKQGFNPGQAVGNRHGITEPLLVEPRTDKSTLRDTIQRSIGTQPRSNASTEPDLIHATLRYLRAHGGSASLSSVRKALASQDYRPPRLSQLRSLLRRQPLLIEVGVSDFIKPIRAFSRTCTCGKRFKACRAWALHALQAIEEHEEYRKLFEALEGPLFCLECGSKHSTGLELLLHSAQEHEELCIVLFVTFAGGASHAPELLAACATGENWDWRLYLEETHSSTVEPIQGTAVEISDSDIEIVNIKQPEPQVIDLE